MISSAALSPWCSPEGRGCVWVCAEQSLGLSQTHQTPQSAHPCSRRTFTHRYLTNWNLGRVLPGSHSDLQRIPTLQSSNCFCTPCSAGLSLPSQITGKIKGLCLSLRKCLWGRHFPVGDWENKVSDLCYCLSWLEPETPIWSLFGPFHLELNSMILEGPFHLRTFCDSLIKKKPNPSLNKGSIWVTAMRYFRHLFQGHVRRLYLWKIPNI